MIENRTFIITATGTQEVIVVSSRIPPGAFSFVAHLRAIHFLGKIIPYRGSWVEFEYDQKNLLYVRIDRKRKFLGTIFLRVGTQVRRGIDSRFFTRPI